MKNTKNLVFLTAFFVFGLPLQAENKPIRPFDPLDAIVPPDLMQEGAGPDKAFDPHPPPSMAQGVILGFNHWPLSAQEKAQLDQVLNPAQLTTTQEYPRFQAIVLSWPALKKEEEALKICQSLTPFLFLSSCEPNSAVPPAGAWKNILRKLKSKFFKKKQPQMAKLASGGAVWTANPANTEYPRPKNPLPLDHHYYNAPPPGAKLSPGKRPSSGKGNLKSCNIVPSQLGLEEGTLSDYWGQEMVGADLLKKELEKAPPVKKHLISSFDSRYRRHDVAVKNLISGSGRQAVLPPSPRAEQKNLENIDVTYTSMYLGQADRYLSLANEACGAPPHERAGQQGANLSAQLRRRSNPQSNQNCRYINVSGRRALYCGSGQPSACPFRRYDQYGHYVCVERREDLYPTINRLETQ